MRMLLIMLAGLLLAGCKTAPVSRPPPEAKPSPPEPSYKEDPEPPPEANPAYACELREARNGMQAICTTRRSYDDFARNLRHQRDLLMNVAYHMHTFLDVMLTVTREHVDLRSPADMPFTIVLIRRHNALMQRGRELAFRAELYAQALHSTSERMHARSGAPADAERRTLQDNCRARADILADLIGSVRQSQMHAIAFMQEGRSRGVPYPEFSHAPLSP